MSLWRDRSTSLIAADTGAAVTSIEVDRGVAQVLRSVVAARANVTVVEGERKRVQAYEGVVIAKRNRGLNSSFIVRKVSSGEGVERTFQLYSPLISGIEVKRRGDVRRAKLYFLRARRGKAARLREAE